MGVRSAIERRWRGAKGEVGGVEGVEYVRTCVRVKLRRAVVVGRNDMVLAEMRFQKVCRSVIGAHPRRRALFKKRA